MTRKTHIAVGVMATLPIVYTTKNYYSIVGLLGATAPDIDIILGIKHRTITHSIVMLCITSLPIFIFNFNIGLIWFLNYFIHLILDSFTKMGVPFLYPWITKYYGYKKIRTGSVEDLFLCLISIYIISYFFIF
ncbi:metal-dependent hydrolase [Clostridium tetani]|uniref:metal-dependent hydrolase n=1 Tax=Clostridium tetani TaxID=1513 RepID=UPI0010287AB6|nr:metal-dependent hydrolase [Clostridium tetani]RXI70483.1 metal-dependent hydrolase [Clostridium tetani]